MVEWWSRVIKEREEREGTVHKSPLPTTGAVIVPAWLPAPHQLAWASSLHVAPNPC